MTQEQRNAILSDLEQKREIGRSNQSTKENAPESELEVLESDFIYQSKTEDLNTVKLSSTTKELFKLVLKLENVKSISYELIREVMPNDDILGKMNDITDYVENLEDNLLDVAILNIQKNLIGDDEQYSIQEI
ncbi:MAG: hypothetical protein J6M30_02090 [Bacteroidales bacterium]|nr:hypothetical protein [Bacteroidales bacterium]